MNEILLHIGYHKTGSTWLQHELFSNHDAFKLVSKGEKAHSIIAKNFICDPKKYILSPFEVTNPQIKESVELVSKEQEAGKISVISHERLSGSLFAGGFDSKIIADRLKTAFPNAKIFIMVREQKSLITSSYFQYLETGGTLSIARFLKGKYDGKLPHFSPYHFDFVPLITHYFSLFGRGNVLVLPYEMFRDNPEEFFSEVSTFSGKVVKIEAARLNIIRNKKESHFVNYYFRNLNIFLKSTSVNNYSGLNNIFLKSITWSIIWTLRRATPGFLNKRAKQNVEKFVNEWCGELYNSSNIDLEKLIDVDLSRYSYYKI